MINFNNIFGTFNDSEHNKEIDEVSMLVDFSEHPLYWLGGFSKTISNHLLFNKYIVKTFKNVSSELELEDLEKIGEYLTYDRAWNYIKNIKIENPFHVECIKLKADEKLIVALEISIIHFEKLEEYEKCALLKDVNVKVKDFLI